MNNKKYSNSEAENADNSMKWEEDEGIERLGTSVVEDGASSFDTNVALRYTFNQPSTSGCTGQKRKSSFSSPPPAKISRDIWSEKKDLEEHPSANEANRYYNREISSRICTVPSLPQMMQVEQRGIPSQVLSDNILSVFVKDDKNRSEGDISTDFANHISSLFYPTISSRYLLSHPSTSGCTGRKRKSSFPSPPPAKISGNIWSRKQQQDVHPFLNKTNPYNNSEVASGFAIAPLFPQMMQVEQRSISSQAYSDNISSLLVKAHIERSKGKISTNFLPDIGTVLNPIGTFRCLTKFGRDRQDIIRILDTEGSSFDTEDPLGEEETQPNTERYSLFHKKVNHFWSKYNLPEPYHEALLRHLKNYITEEKSSKLHFFDMVNPAMAFGCSICRIFSSLTYP